MDKKTRSCRILSEAMRSKALAELPMWRMTPTGNAIWRRLRFPDFPTAIAFMGAVALEAEEQNHHPEWTNIYDRVDILLCTHDAGGVTKRDMRLARTVDAAAERFGGRDGNLP